MTFTPDVFQCGVDVGGPTNLITFVESIADADARADMQRKIGGDPATEEGLCTISRTCDAHSQAASS